MKTALTTLALAALLCGCNASDDDRTTAAGAMDDTAEVEVPERFRGEWAASAAACDRPGEFSRLHVGDDAIRFYESEGPIVSVAGSGDTATLQARLTGEGETWVESYTFTVSRDGNTLTDSTNGIVRVRCD